MQCRHCDYPLWNLSTRVCPECGAPFLPSEYEFTPHSVRFCCPHCDHPYYGTSDSGHIEPTEFGCLKCGQRINLDEMVLRPGLGIEDRRTRAVPMPWLERRERGRIRAWFRMIGRSMTAPAELGRSIPAEASVLEAWVYATGTLTLFLIAATTFPFTLQALVMGFGGPFTFFGMPSSMQFVYLFAWIAGHVAVCGLLLWTWAVVSHVLLLMTGGAPGGFRRTAHAIFYSAGASVITALPCFGFMIGWILWAASGSIMLRETQRIRGLRAGIAVFTLPSALAIAAVAAYGILIVTAMRPGMVGAVPGGSSTTQQLSTALLATASTRGGVGPEHALELHGSPYLTTLTGPPGSAFLEPGTQTTPEGVTLGDITLAQFMKMARGPQLRALSDLIESMPPGVAAHRVGDFVFTHHGLPLNTYDSNLWVVVMIPDPGANPALPPSTAIHIGTADYQVQQVRLSQLPFLLKEQNQHRRDNGLPELPDLTSVTHDAPGITPAPEPDA